jgi:nucleotide-binding universal stress UspA family protein
MFNKILIPLDGTKAAEQVIPLLNAEAGLGTEVHLLKVNHPLKTQSLGGQVILGSQREDAERLESLSYLRNVAKETGNLERWHFGIVMADRASEGIVSYAEENGIDTIYLFVPDRKGLAKLMKGNTCRGVQKNATAVVKVLLPRI